MWTASMSTNSALLFLFPSLQVVSGRRPSAGSAALRRTVPAGKSKTLPDLQRALCVQLKQRQILPGVPGEGAAATGRRTQAETAVFVTQ